MITKQKKRKNYNQWVHAKISILHNPVKPMLNGITTICGKSARHIISTSDTEKITCKRCLEEISDIKKNNNEETL